MIERKLMPFQENGINKAAEMLKSIDRLLMVSPGGSGKGVIIANICHRFVSKNRKCCIFVHSHLLLEQVRVHLIEWFGILSQKIDADTINIDNNNLVYVCMVQTYDRRSSSESFRKFFSNCGLLLVDEVHRGDFNKIYDHFPCKQIGFTATPVHTKKNPPLNEHWQNILIIATQTDMIELNSQFPERGVVPNLCFSPKNIDRSQLAIKGGEFDEDKMGDIFRQNKPLQATVDNYLRLAFNKKTICFNSNRKHSLDQHEVFLSHGLNSRHLDSKKSEKYGTDRYRKDTLEWFKNTPDAILNNIGILTTGYDEKSVENVIINKSVISLSLWIQMVVRGSRPFKYPDGTYKTHFTTLDMGNNAPADGGNLGDCNENQEWEYMFRNPKMPKPGIGAFKSCPDCGSLNYISARICGGMTINPLSDEVENCDFLFPITEKENDSVPVELVLASKTIDVRKTIEFFPTRHVFFLFNETINQICNIAKKNNITNSIDDVLFLYLYDIAKVKCAEIYKLMDKSKFPNFYEEVKNTLYNSLQKFGFEMDVEIKKPDLEKSGEL